MNALWLVGVLVALLALTNLASTTAFFAIISLGTVALYISYIPPITFLLIRKLKGLHTPLGPWNLGIFSVPINIFAICYAIFMIIWLPFPTTLPVTGNTMNYSSPVWIGCMLFALVNYFINGHRFQSSA